MKRSDFAIVLAYLAAGTGKTLTKPQVEVYFDLLQDLPLEALQFAAKRALLESEYPVYPQVGTLRKLSIECLRAERPPAAEAYRLVLWCINSPSALRQERIDSLPNAVRLAAEAMGWKQIGDSDNVETCRAQFTRCYEAYVERERREALLPLQLKAQFIDLVKNPEAPLVLDNRPARQILAKIGFKV